MGSEGKPLCETNEPVAPKVEPLVPDIEWRDIVMTQDLKDYLRFYQDTPYYDEMVDSTVKFANYKVQMYLQNHN
jgi:hypothetical protein